MKKFLVHLEKVVSFDIEVEANSAEEAENKVWDVAGPNKFQVSAPNSTDISYVEICYTDEIKEENKNE